MRTFVFCTGLLLAVTLAPSPIRSADFSVNSHQRWDTKGSYNPGFDAGTPTSCPVKLRPSGHCGGSGVGAEEGEDCPYQLTLPPLTIQLPKQFRLLEKTLKEVQSLKEVVNKLKRGYQECCGTRGTEAFGYQQADQGQAQDLTQLDTVRDKSPDGIGNRVQSGSSQEERGDGMIHGAGVEGKARPFPRDLQEMQVRG